MAAVKIVVKNVYKAGQTREFLVPRGASVRELKSLVAREFPENPAPADQKLIFGGKICSDSDVLDELLAQQGQGADSGEDEDVVAVVFHLLVTSKAAASPKANTSEAASTLAAEDAAVDSPRPSAATPTQTPPPFTAPNLFTPPPVSAASNAVPSPVPAASASMPSASQHELYRQMALMQQQAMILTQIQYLQQLQQHQANAPGATPVAYNPAGHAFAAPLMPPMMPFANYFGGHMAHFPAHFPAAGAAAGAHAPAAPAHAVPAAPRGPPPMVVVMLREIMPLFEIRLALKMAFMLFLIGQDTPTDRVLMLGLLSFISYLHITGIFAKIYEVYQRRRNPEAAGNGAGDQQAAGQGAATPRAGGAGGMGGGVSLATRLLRISSDRGMVQDVKYFVTGLLLSLVPAWHPQPLAGGAAPVPPPENAIPEGEIPLQGI